MQPLREQVAAGLRADTGKKVRIILNDRSYEYDVYTLVIAFFQGIPVSVSEPVSQKDREVDDVSGLCQGELVTGRTEETISKGLLTIEVIISDTSITVEARRADQRLVRRTAGAGEKLQTGQLTGKGCRSRMRSSAACTTACPH